MLCHFASFSSANYLREWAVCWVFEVEQAEHGLILFIWFKLFNTALCVGPPASFTVARCSPPLTLISG